MSSCRSGRTATGDADHPLADHLTVTYIANLAQLVSPPAQPQRPRTRGAVFALSYDDQPRLPHLDSSESEGRAIAELLRTEPRLDSVATEPAFADALESARWVHLRAHGKHDVDAPMFQTVFLSPDEGHDGRLRALGAIAGSARPRTRDARRVRDRPWPDRRVGQHTRTTRCIAACGCKCRDRDAV